MKRAGATFLRRLACLASAVAAPAMAASVASESAAQAPERVPPEAGATRLDPAVLQEVLRSLGLDSGGDESFLETAWRWLRERFADRGIVLDDWLGALLEMPDSALEVASRLSIGAMVVLALLLLANELRQRPAGSLGWRRWRLGRVGAAPPARPGWSSVSSLPPAEQPGAALKMALAALADGGTIVAAAATHRDVLATARRVRKAPWRRPLARLALLAERARFGRWRPSREQGAEAVALGRAVAVAALR